MKKVLEPNHLDAQKNKTKCKNHNHKSKLQQDEHYTCGNCNLMIETPELYDSQVLSFTDYLKVFSLQLLFAYFEMFIRSQNEKNQLQNTVNNLINNIRKKPRYLDKYKYLQYSHQESLTNEENVNSDFIEIQSVNFKDILIISSKPPVLSNLILGFHAQQTLKIKLPDAITEQINPIELAECISNTNNLMSISTAISHSKEIISFNDKSNIFIGDYLVKIKIRAYYLEFYYSEIGELKSVFIEKIKIF